MKSFLEKHFLWTELIIGSLIVAALISIIERVAGDVWLTETLRGNRVTLYGVVTQVAASLLGFIVAAIAIIVSFSESSSVRIFRESGQYSALFRVCYSAVRWLGATTVVAFAAILIDSDAAPKKLMTYLTMWLVIISAVRV